MCFHVRITFTDVNPKASRSVIAIGETILVGDNVTILTGSIPRKYTDISYALSVNKSASYS